MLDDRRVLATIVLNCLYPAPNTRNAIQILHKGDPAEKEWTKGQQYHPNYLTNVVNLLRVGFGGTGEAVHMLC